EDSHDPDWPRHENLELVSMGFLSLWGDIAKKRNHAAHSQAINIQSFISTENLFGKFQAKYIKELYPIKESLQQSNINSLRIE
ncbi:MAG: hypothetical protein II683_05775, partial [Muribaculaceae bacterium]|nr:hypothetical protein [Muribaculaceae bacterium]